MRTRFIIFVVLILLIQQLHSQIKLDNITLASELVYGLNGINYVTRAVGWGFSGELKFGFENSSWKLKVVSGYSDLKLEPSDSMTIERWNWDYWRIWYRSHVRSLIVDSNYAVNLGPSQRLYLLPVKFFIGKEFGNRFKFYTGFGAGVIFYERAFWLNETWWKKFRNLPDSGEVYVFQYSFKNNAPSKKGTILGLGLQLSGNYKITKIVNIGIALEYEHYPSINKIDKVELGKITLGEVGESYRNFTLRDVLRLSFGFSFNY